MITRGCEKYVDLDNEPSVFGPSPPLGLFPIL